jgi:3-deoxy-D-manno-octulosonic-acid transferase
MGRPDQRQHIPFLPWLGYNGLAVPAMMVGAQVGRLVDPKIRTGFEERRKVYERFELNRAALEGCVWFHASSAGEYEQARPILQALRERFPQRFPTLATVFSPSGHARASAYPDADVVEYLPFDTLTGMERLVGRLRPRALVFVKYDCWPNLVWTARRHRVPSVLLGASLHRASQRSSGLARHFFRSVYGSLDAIGTIGPSDADRFQEQLGVRPERIHVTGDSRVDQIIRRHEDGADSPLVDAFDGLPWRYLVLGSTWPKDDEAFLPAAADALHTHGECGLILAPHEPGPRALERIEARLRSRGLEAVRLSQLVEPRTSKRRTTAAAKNPSSWRVILVDSVGQLATLYRMGHVAFVGGGFTTGVHSVLEPAVCGLPVIFGPRHANAIEAGRLLEAGGGACARDREEAAALLKRWLDDEAARDEASRKALDQVQAQRGATARNLDLLVEVAQLDA